MDFLTSPEGILYNAPALALLAVLLWRRPLLGTVVAVFAGLRVGGPIVFGQEMIPFSVHITLGVAAAFAWSLEDVKGSIFLFVAGVALLYFVEYSIGWLIHLPPENVELGKGFLVGMALGIGRAAVLVVMLIYRHVAEKKDPTPAKGMGQ